MKRIIFILCIVISIINNKSYSQEWPKIYGDTFHSLISDLCETYDKGFILIGYTYDIAGVPEYGWIIKTDINGDVLWDKKIGNSNYMNGLSCSKITNDKGLIIAGASSKYSMNDFDPLFIKTNSCGEIEWCKIYRSPGHNYGTGILQVDTDCYVGMLQYFGEDSTYSRINLVKMDNTGEPIWIQRLAQDDTLINNEEGEYLYYTKDNNYLISGDCFYPGWKPFWIKTDSSGNQIWDLMWQGGIGGASQVVENENNSFYSAGGFSDGTYSMTPSIFKFDKEGYPIYQKFLLGDTLIGGGAKTIAYFNDSVLLTGIQWRISPNIDDGNSEILMIDTLGSIIRRRILLDENNPPVVTFKTSDNKILVTGNYVVDDNWDIYLWKMNSYLEDDTLYTQPLTYDSLCPYEIQSDTVDLDCDLFVNIDELPTKEEYESTVKISPNPAHGWVALTLPDVVAEGKVQVVVYDVYGREAGRLGGMEAGKHGGMGAWGHGGMEKLPVNRMVVLDVSGYPPGMYVVVVMDGKGRRYSGKVVVI